MLAGELEFRVGKSTIVAKSGDRVLVPAGTPHRFRNVGEVTAHFVCEVSPALGFEQLIETMFALAADGKVNREGAAESAPARGDRQASLRRRAIAVPAGLAAEARARAGCAARAAARLQAQLRAGGAEGPHRSRRLGHTNQASGGRRPCEGGGALAPQGARRSPTGTGDLLCIRHRQSSTSVDTTDRVSLVALHTNSMERNPLAPDDLDRHRRPHRIGAPLPFEGRARPARADQTTVRQANLGVVLRRIAAVGSCSRAEVAAATGLTRGTVSSLVNELVELDLVRETGETALPAVSDGPGRRSSSRASSSVSASRSTSSKW